MNSIKEVRLELPLKSKHNLINDASYSLNDLVNHAQDLLDRIRGDVSPTAPESVEKTKPSHSLSDTLNNVPSRLYDVKDRLHNILNLIQEELF